MLLSKKKQNLNEIISTVDSMQSILQVYSNLI